MSQGQQRLRAIAVMFDVDGTLFDSRDAFCLMIRDMFAREGWTPPERADLLKLIGRTNDYIANALIPPEFRNQETVKRWSRMAEELWVREYLPRHVRLYPGAREFLSELDRRGFILVVVSNGSSTEIPLYLRLGGIAELMDLVVTADDVRRPKPYPDPLDLARAKLNLEREDCVYVGDTWMDAEASKGAGLACVLVTWGIGNREELEGQTHAALVDSFDELLDLLAFPAETRF
jgi:HAD superfamily hydrolase (TIGR01549 family)